MLESIYQFLMGSDGTALIAIAPLVIAAGISAAASIGNAIFGSKSAAKQRRQQIAAINKMQQENRNWYNRAYNEDATNRADAQRAITRVNEEAKKRSKAAAGRKAVIGGTDASQAQVQQANANAMGNALGDITARADARKDSIQQQYRSQNQQLEAQKSNVNANFEAAKRENTAAAATGVIKAAGSVIANSGSGSSSSGATRTDVADPTRFESETTKFAEAKQAYNQSQTPETRAANESISKMKEILSGRGDNDVSEELRKKDYGG